MLTLFVSVTSAEILKSCDNTSAKKTLRDSRTFHASKVVQSLITKPFETVVEVKFRSIVFALLLCFDSTPKEH